MSLTYGTLLPIVFSTSNAGSTHLNPIPSAMQTIRKNEHITVDLRMLNSPSLTMSLEPQVSLSSLKFSLGFLFFPTDMRIGVIMTVVVITKNTHIAVSRPIAAIGRIGITRNERRDTIVVRPQNSIGQPVSDIVSMIALRRCPWISILLPKYVNKWMLYAIDTANASITGIIVQVESIYMPVPPAIPNVISSPRTVPMKGAITPLNDLVIMSMTRMEMISAHRH